MSKDDLLIEIGAWALIVATIILVVLAISGKLGQILR